MPIIIYKLRKAEKFFVGPGVVLQYRSYTKTS